MNSDNMFGYIKDRRISIIFLRFFLIVFFLFFLTLINRTNIDYISGFVPITTFCITVLVIFDYYVTHFSGSQFLFRIWWIAYILAANMTVFGVLTLFKTKNYTKFYYNFWYGITPLYVFTLIICFLRTPFTNLSMNFKLFNGTFLMLKAIINHYNGFEPYVIFIGNVVVFFPLPFILSALFKRLKPYQFALIGFLVPFIVEGYQYLFKCGDVDIDDVILNWLGFFIGFAIQQIIKKRLLEKE